MDVVKPSLRSRLKIVHPCLPMGVPDRSVTWGEKVAPCVEEGGEGRRDSPRPSQMSVSKGRLWWELAQPTGSQHLSLGCPAGDGRHTGRSEGAQPLNGSVGGTTQRPL